MYTVLCTLRQAIKAIKSDTFTKFKRIKPEIFVLSFFVKVTKRCYASITITFDESYVILGQFDTFFIVLFMALNCTTTKKEEIG